VYNLVENLCIATGMVMPKINIIEDDSLNAFASGINSNTFTISLS
jgi:heat shock protein HtpX